MIREPGTACNVKRVAWAVLLLIAFGPNDAWAYLDPGTGSLMLQLLLGGIAGALVVARLYMQRIRAVFRCFLPKKSTFSERK